MSTTRNAALWIVLVIVAQAAAPQAMGQAPFGQRPASPTPAPTVSPYLNLLRRGTSAGVNYYGLVRPELEFRNAYRGLQQQVDLQRAEQGSDRRIGLPETGHPAVFLDTRGYFLNNSTQGQSAPGRVTSGIGPGRRR